MLGQNWFRDIQVKYFRFCNFNIFLLKAEDSLDYKHCMQGIHLTLERLHIRETHLQTNTVTDLTH